MTRLHLTGACCVDVNKNWSRWNSWSGSWRPTQHRDAYESVDGDGDTAQEAHSWSDREERDLTLPLSLLFLPPLPPPPLPPSSLLPPLPHTTHQNKGHCDPVTHLHATEHLSISSAGTSPLYFKWHEVCTRKTRPMCGTNFSPNNTVLELSAHRMTKKHP